MRMPRECHCLWKRNVCSRTKRRMQGTVDVLHERNSQTTKLHGNYTTKHRHGPIKSELRESTEIYCWLLKTLFCSRAYLPSQGEWSRVSYFSIQKLCHATSSFHEPFRRTEWPRNIAMSHCLLLFCLVFHARALLIEPEYQRTENARKCRAQQMTNGIMVPVLPPGLSCSMCAYLPSSHEMFWKCLSRHLKCVWETSPATQATLHSSRPEHRRSPRLLIQHRRFHENTNTKSRRSAEKWQWYHDTPHDRIATRTYEWHIYWQKVK
jgi:hypothetical protein